MILILLGKCAVRWAAKGAYLGRMGRCVVVIAARPFLELLGTSRSLLQSRVKNGQSVKNLVLDIQFWITDK